MNRIKQLFIEKKENILSVYFTAGYPELEDTVNIIRTLSAAHVDMIEIGIPFSDPLADGHTIQESSNVALRNGMSLNRLFRQLTAIRTYTDIPLILMGYLNSVMQFGIEAFCKRAKQCGIDGVIIPDLPVNEYLSHFKHIFASYGLSVIFLVTPQTEVDRLRFIDSISDGFIYLVTSASTTGGQRCMTSEQLKAFDKIRQLSLNNSILAGFGINDRDDFNTVCRYFNGAIIGSSFIRTLSRNEEHLENSIHDFIKSII